MKTASTPGKPAMWTRELLRCGQAAGYIRTNIYITSSGMLQERLLRHTLDFTSAERVMFSTDYPFHRPDATSIGQFFDAIADPADRAMIASGNAETLFRLA